MSPDRRFGAELRDLRDGAGLTQEGLSERSGVPVRTISDLERGQVKRPHQGTVDALVKGLALASDDREVLLALARGEPAPPRVAHPFRRVFIPPTPLIGREQATADVSSLLADPNVRLVTLTGAAGVGKTRLAERAAAHSARRFPDGVVDADLGAVWDYAALLREIAVALAAPDLETDADGLAALIGDRRLLLVLDNFEQIVDEAALLARLVARSQKLKILTTSRVPLRIRGEHKYEVAPLAFPGPHDDRDQIANTAAVQMFTACARARDARWRLDAAAQDVAAVCRAVDGIPLAIELATSRLGPLDTGELARLIADRLGTLGLLNDGPRDLPQRQRTLSATLEWTYELLPEQARALLRRLAAFPDSYGAETVVEVCAKPAGLDAVDAIGALAVLVDFQLIRRQPSGRYAPYQSVREFSAQRLAESGEQSAAEAAHASFAVRLGEAAAEHLTGPDQAHWFGRLESHHEDLHVAVERLARAGDQLGAARLGGAVWRYWYTRGRIGEGLQLLEQALAEEPPADAAECAIWARAYGGVGALRHTAGDSVGARAAYARSAEFWERSGDHRGLSGALVSQGMYEQYNGSPEEAGQVYARALEIARATGDPRTLGVALVNLGSLLVHEGRAAEAEPLLDEALARFRDCRDLRGEADTLGTRAELAVAQGEHLRARRLAAAAQDLFEELGDQRGVNECLHVQAAAATALDEHAQAHELYGRSVAAHRGLADPWGTAEALLGQATAALLLGHRDEATKLAREARALSAGHDDKRGIAKADGVIGQADGPDGVTDDSSQVRPAGESSASDADADRDQFSATPAPSN